MKLKFFKRVSGIKVPKDVMLIIHLLEKAGFEAFAVGGCVRDSLLKREPQDWDITTSAPPARVREIFHRTVDTGLKHGTVTVLLGGKGYEVTTYRVDGTYSDSRHPDSVRFTSDLAEDLKRRDFTINAMAYNPSTGLADLFGGFSDLQTKTIRCVGDPCDRFKEDALRILRAIRFAAQLGFKIDEQTREAVRKLAPSLNLVSRERVRAELEKLICSPNPEMLRDAYSLGVTKQVLPEFDLMMTCVQHSRYHMYTVGEHTLKVMENVPANRLMRWAALLHDVGKPAVKTTDGSGTDHFKKHAAAGAVIAKNILRDLKTDNKTIGIVTRLVACHDRIQDLELSEEAVRRSIHEIGEDIYPMFLTLAQADYAGKSPYGQVCGIERLDYAKEAYPRIIARGDCISLKTLAVSGRDLIDAGIGPGAVIGEILEKLLDWVLKDPGLNEKSMLLKIAAGYMDSKQIGK